MDSECLVIIYYIGRGEVRHQLGNVQLWMQGRQQTNEQTPEINFSMVRETAIDHQPAKVLMLLDRYLPYCWRKYRTVQRDHWSLLRRTRGNARSIH